MIPMPESVEHVMDLMDQAIKASCISTAGDPA